LRVVAGRLAQEIVYSDDTVMAFLNSVPATTGHMLVVPREHRRDIWDIQAHEAAVQWRVLDRPQSSSMRTTFETRSRVPAN
jgi:histidine triad (HIT) family protein